MFVSGGLIGANFPRERALNADEIPGTGFENWKVLHQGFPFEFQSIKIGTNSPQVARSANQLLRTTTSGPVSVPELMRPDGIKFSPTGLVYYPTAFLLDAFVAMILIAAAAVISECYVRRRER